MTKKNDNHESLLNEKDLGKLENSLRKLASEGELDFPLTERMRKKYEKDLSPATRDRMWKHIQLETAVAERFRACRDREEGAELSFPEMLRTLRTKAGVSVDEFALAARLKASDITTLELGQIDPLKVPASVMATVMEVCWLPLSLVEQSLKRFLAAQAARASFSGVAARFSGVVSDGEYERVFQDVASHVAGKTVEEVALPVSYSEALRKALKLRGRIDLL
jgi:ribosome-binding protein aMBF1 (putative translation factor)